LTYHKPETNLVKQNPEKSSELVENFSELKEYFQGTKWGSFFHE
jgi:hypothetical protein